MASAQKRRKTDGGAAVAAMEVPEAVAKACVEAMARARADVGSVEYLVHPSSREVPGVGPSSVGPSSVGPSSGGPSSLGPSRARERCPALLASSVGPSNVGPSSFGPSSFGPSSLGPSSFGPSSFGPSRARQRCSAHRRIYRIPTEPVLLA